MNSEIIQMTDQMNMMFETHDLSSASPATISRCGMVYLAKTAFGGPMTLMKSWLNLFKVNCKLDELKEADTELLLDRIMNLYNFVFMPVMEETLKSYALIIPV